jgi:hypothetical protein
MDHREIREMIPLLAIGRLEGEDRQKVLRHLEVCGECRKIYENERQLTVMMEGMTREILPPPPPVIHSRPPYVRYALSFLAVASIVLVAFLLLRNPQKGRYGDGDGVPQTVEVSGLDDLWNGYILVQGKGPLKVEVAVDGSVVAEGSGEGYVYLKPDIKRGEHYVVVRVITGKDTLAMDRVVLYDPETYALATGEE